MVLPAKTYMKPELYSKWTTGWVFLTHFLKDKFCKFTLHVGKLAQQCSSKAAGGLLVG